jgi:hypothetical protein
MKAVLEQRCTQLEERIAALELLVKDLTTINAVVSLPNPSNRLASADFNYFYD